MSSAPAVRPDLHDLDPADIGREYERRRLDQVSDIALVEGAATVLARGRADEPDSFVLHAPLELLARAALLPHVSAAARDGARRQIVSIAARFEAFGPPSPATADEFAHPEEALDALRGALTEGDVDTAGAAGRHLGRVLEPAALARAIGDHLAPSLAAAAHGPIFLHHLPRAAPRSPLAGAMFGTLAREVARHADWSLAWHRDGLRGAGDLARALAATPVLGPPGSTFIFPLMHQAESSGLAAEVVGGSLGDATDPLAAARAIVRTATASMLLDDTDHAPYGWSHCLTIPQGILGLLPTTAAPHEVLALAATHVVGFRAALGSAPLTELSGPPGRVRPDALVDRAVRPGDDALQAAIDFAATHEDAHLTKYLVACMDEARADPPGAAQHLAAAVHLTDWWRALES